MRISNYDKSPAIEVSGAIWLGWEAIVHELTRHIPADCPVVAVECYQGVYLDRIAEGINRIPHALFIDTRTLFKSPAEIESLTRPYLTDDRLFGRRNTLSYTDLLDMDKVVEARRAIAKTTCKGTVLVCGHAASIVAPDESLLVYADMARWEIQMRSRRNEVNGLGVENAAEAPSLHYKRGYFLDWMICDNLKKKILSRVGFWLDTHVPSGPKMIARDTFLDGLEATALRPFRVVPFFDPAPWGGQWMKEVCDLDRSQANYGWCFDCVPEENSLYFNIGGVIFELPASNLVFHCTRQLLGAPVEARFGQDFPIRFDFLDTMGGGNLSLQVHPTTQYIRDTFGMIYTQDESYYLLDAEEDKASVYLGLQTDVCPDDMIAGLNRAQLTGGVFPVERYVNRWPAHRHDHFLIPAGTVHCSGSGAMVLEISATPSIFTFKLYDWGRLGLDGQPRPINIAHGSNVIEWDRRTDWVDLNLVNRIQTVTSGDGWVEERTGLHETEFIETRRHWFTSPVTHNTSGGVNVLNLIEGDEAVVESPTGAFEPYVVHYAETFIVPACVGEYTIRPHGPSRGKRCGTIKAYVRFHE